jgi:hypothetical protein
MKAKKFYILLLGALLSLQVSAERTTFKEQSENWLQNTGESGGSGKPGIPGTTDEPDNPKGAPSGSVGDALGVLLTLAVAYGASRQMRKKSRPRPA